MVHLAKIPIILKKKTFTVTTNSSNSLELKKSSSFVPMMSQFLKSHLVWIVPFPVMFCTPLSEDNLQPLHTTWKEEHNKLITELFLRRCLQHEYGNTNMSFTIFYGVQINRLFSPFSYEIKKFILKVEETIKNIWKMTVKEEEKKRSIKGHAWHEDFFTQLYDSEVICFHVYDMILDESCNPQNMVHFKTNSCYIRLVSNSLAKFCKHLSKKISLQLVEYFSNNLHVPETYPLKEKHSSFLFKIQNLTTTTNKLLENALCFPPLAMEEPKWDWPTFFLFKWKEVEIQSIPLLLIHNWKVQVAQCVINKTCPSVRDLTHLLLHVFEKIKFSIYFHPFFWNKSPLLQSSVSLKDQLPIVVSERCIVQSLFEYLHERCRVAYTQTNFELDKTLHNFNSIGEFMTYVRGCIRWILDFATLRIPRTFLCILPYPLYTELIAFCKSPWNELPFPPQYYSGVWNFFTVNSKTSVIDSREKDYHSILCDTNSSTLSSNLHREPETHTTDYPLSKKQCQTILNVSPILPQDGFEALSCLEKEINSRAPTTIPPLLSKNTCLNISHPISSFISCKSFSMFPSYLNLMNTSVENEKQEEESYNLLKKRLHVTFEKLKNEIAQNYVSTNTLNQYCENNTF
ncbi:uncharacterized protein LOC128884469 [Hylaeus volcanicus]|uniref:uncharacterized protein LOC128884469 n=1 Tax=Hylaeus volcanicus TaxID=313075 RepID=UPI0023B7F790|nr:uncharacterized protein LOC128884469 [Hylaeus volcanicus]